MRPVVRYGIALLSVAVAIVGRYALGPELGAHVPFATFFFAILVSVWLGGLGPGLVAVVAAAGANHFLFGVPHQIHMLAWVVVGTVIVSIDAVLRTARARADEARQRELAARQLAEAARERVAFIADAAAALATSLDYEETLQRLADLLVPRLGDWCAVDIVDPDGTIRRVAARHRDPVLAGLARATTVYPADPERRHPRTEVIRTGRAQLFPEVTDAWLTSITAEPLHLGVMRALALLSVMIVPLVARDRTLGAITCATTTTSGRRYDTDDLALAEEIAHRAALALDNAALFRAAEAARREAQEANRAKDQFLSIVSHELRTPLSSTLGWLRVLRSGKSEQTTRALDTIERGVHVQAKLIEDLLDVSRMVAGRLHLDPRPLDLARVVEAALDAVRPEAEAKGVRLYVAAAPAAAPMVGDPDRLQQIVSNLLSNAIKFTPARGRVAVRLAARGPQFELVVADTGIGIESAFLPHVFEHFRQAAPVTNREQGGLGLGLAITRHLVELHGGTIRVASAGKGAGTTATVVLPASPPVAQATPDAQLGRADRTEGN